MTKRSNWQTVLPVANLMADSESVTPKFLFEFNSNPSFISLSFGDIRVKHRHWQNDGWADNADRYYVYIAVPILAGQL